MGGFSQTVIGLLDKPAATHDLSTVKSPIGSLSFLRRSLLLAELSNLAYHTRAEAGQLAFQMGFPEIRYYEHDGAQAYIFANDDDAVVACRGTEPHDWNDVRANLDLGKAVAETVGWIHRGFKREVDDIWPRLEQALLNNTRTLWFSGHSLGGAMAAICAGRCQLSYIPSNPRALYTFGSPRIGSRRYVNYVRFEAYRWVNNNDAVVHLPPAWMGFRHKGEEVYLNAYGQIRRDTVWQRLKDRWRGFVKGLREGRFDPFSDHAMAEYIRHIRALVEIEEREPVILRMRPIAVGRRLQRAA